MKNVSTCIEAKTKSLKCNVNNLTKSKSLTSIQQKVPHIRKRMGEDISKIYSRRHKNTQNTKTTPTNLFRNQQIEIIYLEISKEKNKQMVWTSKSKKYEVTNI